MIKVLCASRIILALFAACVMGLAQGENRLQKPKADLATDATHRSPFRYVIVAGVSEIEQYVNRPGAPPALVVLMEDQAFTESNLVTLFSLINRRYSKHSALSVDVYTTLEAIATPEENDGVALWGPNPDYKRYKYAFYVRNGLGERFGYGIPGKVKEKMVWLK